MARVSRPPQAGRCQPRCRRCCWGSAGTGRYGLEEIVKSTHFGYQQLPEADKVRRVAAVFDSVAGRYDLMNDLMSAGLHRLWKRALLERSGVRQGERVLDLAGGTGDLARLFAPRVGAPGAVVLADINRSMLKLGRDRSLDSG